MPKRSHRCDVCGAPRLGWQRLCDACFHALPPYLRNPVLANWRAGNKPAWRQATKAAKAALDARATDQVRRVAERTAAMLGERDL